MSKARQLADLGNQIDDGAITGTNMVINGGLTVWQRGTSHAAGSGINYTADRFWRYNPSATGTIERSTDAPDGFEYSLFFNVTGGGNNLGTGVELTRQGFFPQQMYTLSMYLKGNFSGTSTYVNFRNSAGSGTDNVDITSFNSFGNYSDWTRVTIPVDTTGISPNANNLFMNIEFGAFPNGGKITGVCLNVGDSAIDFPHRSYGDELARCQRYFQAFNADSGSNTILSNGIAETTSQVRGAVPLLVQMRAVPSVSVSDITHFRFYTTGQHNFTGGAINGLSKKAMGIFAATSASMTAGHAGQVLYKSASGHVHADAEL